MTCATCGRANPADARFCGGCGDALAPRCPACGAACEPDARFCHGCGARVRGDAPEKAIARKLVTVVFADLIGSMSLHERLDAESGRRVMDRYHRTMTTAVEVHGGHVVQLLGDGVLAAFGVPRVAEDDAIRAVRAAVGMQRAFRELACELGATLADVGLRVAVNTGEVVVSNDETAVIGDPTNVAARLQHEARDGDVIVGEGTERLVADRVTLAPLGSLALRGRAEAVRAYRVVSLEPPARAHATTFVGRDEELRRLLALYEAAVAEPGARLAVLLGSPGLGKSRLLAELARRAGERATVLSARCDAAGGATFAPIAGSLRSLLRIDEGAGAGVLRAAIDAVVPGNEGERARIAAGIGALLSGAPSPPEETFFAVRRLLTALAGVRPVVLAIDDLHWAEPLLLDLVEHLVQWSPDVPLLVIGAARPELRELRSSLATPGPLVAEALTLGGLDASASMRLAAGVVGAAELPAALLGRVLVTSEGNPLYLAELVRMLVQDGTLRREGDRWVTTVEVAKLDMPPTIQVLLAARIERLRPEERAVLERAAVIGRHFSRDAVAHLLPGGAIDLDSRLEALRRSELVEPDTGWYLGEPALRFHHVLIRDAAYRRVLKETRAELHERIADWIEARGGVGTEHEETLGWHLEQAHLNLRELGALDERGRSLGERAARHLGAAGRRALAREDLALAAGLLGRAIDALEAGHGLRAELAPDWCEALLSAGEVGAAARAVDELGRCAEGSERLLAWHACFVGQLAALTDPQSLRATAERAAAAGEVLAAAGDAAGEAKAHAVHAGALARLGAIGPSEVALDKALAAARRARDRRRANAVLAGSPLAALWGPSPVTRASGRCLDVVRVLRITQGAPAVEAVALRCQAIVEALRGRGKAARRMIASSRRMVEELGIAQQVLEADVFAGMIELLGGDASAAEGYLRHAYEGLRSRGLGIDAARAAALLGRALLALGRIDEAEGLSRESEALAGDDLKAAIAWRGVRAEALARRGEVDAALELAGAAVEIAAGTDALLDHADARVALATALRAAGREGEALDQQRCAIELWQAKGAACLLERAQPEQVDPPRDFPAIARLFGPEAYSPETRVGSNCATEHVRCLDAAWAAGDHQTVARLFSPELEVIHHPTGTAFGHEAAVERFQQIIGERDEIALRHAPLAVLGDALALCLVTTTSPGIALGAMDAGAFELAYFAAVEADAEARSTRVEAFAPEQLDDALACFYERHAARLAGSSGESQAAALAAAVAAVVHMDLDAIGPVLTPDVEFTDHRRIGLGTARGAEGYMRGLRSLVELSRAAATHTTDVLRATDRSLLLPRRTLGVDRRSGGAFELYLLVLWIFDAAGRVTHVELFEREDRAAALARAEALEGREPRPGVGEGSSPPASGPVGNAAVRQGDQVRAALRAGEGAAHPSVSAAMGAFADALARRDWGALATCCSPSLVVRDHRRLGWEPLHGPAAYVAALRGLIELAPDTHMRLDHVEVAERGFLVRTSWTGTRDGGPFEEPSLMIGEVDRDGRMARLEQYDLEQLELASASLAALRAAAASDRGTGWLRANAAVAAHDRIVAAIEAGDWVAMRDHFAPDGFLDDRRRLFRTTIDADRAIAWMRSAATAGVTGMRIRRRLLAAFGDRLALEHMVWLSGSAQAPVEIAMLALIEVDAEGRLARVINFDPDDRTAALDEARARREALERADPLWIPPNPAVRVSERSHRAASAGDWDTLRDLCAPDVVIEDRRKLVRTEGSRETLLADARHISTGVWQRATRTLLATNGDRLCLHRDRFTGDPDSGAFEIESLDVTEIDAEGRIVAIVIFDADDRRNAAVEMLDRYMRGEGAKRMPPDQVALIRALQERDLPAMRAALHDDFLLIDHRRAGLGSIGAEAYVASVAALIEQTDDFATDVLYHVAGEEHGSLTVGRIFGTLRDGGPFESVFARLNRYDDRCVGVELFEIHDLERAKQRFAELGREHARHRKR